VSPHIFLSLVGLMYIMTTLSYFKVRRVGMMIAFIGYTIGQVGLIIDSFEIGDRSE
jgi:hypothetical protein